MTTDQTTETAQQSIEKGHDMTDETSDMTDETSDMTDETSDPTDEPDQTDEPDETEDDDSDAEPGDAAGRARREAKKLRTRLRDAEGARDEALGKLDALRRDSLARYVEREHRVNPKLLVSMETDELAELFTPDGGIDAAKVHERITTLADEYGLSRTPMPNPAQGSSGGGSMKPPGHPWKEAFSQMNGYR